MIWIILSIIAGVLFFYKLLKPVDYWKRHGVKQTKPYPIFGDTLNTLIRLQTVPDFYKTVYDMYPECRYTGMYQFNVPVLIIRDPELIKKVGIKDFDHFTDHRMFIDPDSDPLFGKILFALRGNAWREMRSTVSGSFTSSKMRLMFGLMKEVSDNFVQYFLKQDEKIIEVEMKNTFSRYTNDVIATTAFGIQVDSLEHQTNEFYMMGKDAMSLTGIKVSLKTIATLVFPSIAKALKITLFSEHVRRFFRDLVHDTIKMREEKGLYRPDMINVLMEARKGTGTQEENVIDSGFAVAQETTSETRTTSRTQKIILTDDNIASHAVNFFLAGFDTVSSLMSFLAYELAVNQDIQRKLREEIKKTANECNRDITYEALLKMKYLDMVITETLRKWPPFTGLDRVCTKPYTIEPASSGEKAIHIKVGDQIFLPTYAIHRDEKYYSNPEKFDPERFSEKNKNNINPYAYLPFGVGPRNCIGSRFALLEVKTVFFGILLNFEIIPTSKSQIPLKLKKSSFNLAAENGFWFGLKRI